MTRSLCLAATLALAAQAILLPPNVALENLGNPGHGMAHAQLHDPYSQIMMLDCAGCAFAKPSKENNGLIWIQGVENALFLNISVGAQPETLELNRVQFYPPTMSLETSSPVPYIAQVPSTASLVDIKADPAKYTANPLRLTSWSLQADTSQTVNESGEEILSICIQLSALERQPINVPAVTIKALKNTEGQLILLKVETSSEKPHGPHGTLQECKDWPLLCKWRAIIASKFHGFEGMKLHGCHNGKGMMGGRPHHKINRPPPTNMHHGAGVADEHHGPPHRGGPPHHGKGPHHGFPHHRPHGHHGHHKIHRVFHVMGRVMLTIFVPIALGVVAGMMTYLLGMFVGTVITFFWTKVRSARQYQAVALEEQDIESPRSSIEKAEFVDEKVNTEAPPQYAEIEGKEIK